MSTPHEKPHDAIAQHPGRPSENMTLVHTLRCPVCGGTEREPADAMGKSGNQYVRQAAAMLRISVGQLIESTHVFRCLSCHCVFCDPWLSPELASSLFCAGSPDHNAGWAEFEFWLHGPRPVNINQTSKRRLYAAITRRVGPLSSYAEFGCPFMGLLLQFRGNEAARSERAASFARALRRKVDPRWTMLARSHHAMLRWCNRITVSTLQVRVLLQRLFRPSNVSESEDAANPAPPPERRYLLTEDTTKGWGSNCVRYGASCQYFAHTMLNVDVVPLDEAHRNGAMTFDLIGIFSSLDHTTFPLEVLRKSLDLADHVLVATHDASHAGKQHLYAFTDQFTAWLAGEFESISVESLREEVDTEGQLNYSYILLTKREVTGRGTRKGMRRYQKIGDVGALSGGGRA